MRALINGVEGGTLQLYRGQDAVLNVLVITDAGLLIDTTGDVITLSVYDTVDRKNAVAFTAVTCAHVTEAAGLLTATITAAASALLVAGQTYYGFIKRDAGGAGDFSFGGQYISIQVT